MCHSRSESEITLDIAGWYINFVFDIICTIKLSCENFVDCIEGAYLVFQMSDTGRSRINQSINLEAFYVATGSNAHPKTIFASYMGN